MNFVGFWQSIALVLAGALTTGLVSFWIAWQQNRFAERKSQAERAEVLAAERRQHSRQHALHVHSALEDLHELAKTAKRNLDGPPGGPEARRLLKTAREFLLIADADVRTAVADAMTLMSSPARGVTIEDWMDSGAAASFVVAAYLRGDPLPKKYVDRLRELRERYPRPSG